MRECLEDLQGQTIARDLEIVIVDADSPEGEDAIVAEFQRRYDNIRYIGPRNASAIYPAGNLAVRASSGAFLTPMSTNDRLAPDALRAPVAGPGNPSGGGPRLRRYLSDQHPAPGLRPPHPESRLTAACSNGPPYSYEILLVNCRVGTASALAAILHAGIGYFDGRYKAIGDQDYWLRHRLEASPGAHPRIHRPAWITKESLSGHSSSLQEIFDIHNKHTTPIAKAEGPLAGAGPGAAADGPGQGIGFKPDRIRQRQSGTWSGAPHTAAILEPLRASLRRPRYRSRQQPHRPRSLPAGPFPAAGPPLPHPINLFHLNPPALESLFRDLPGLVETRGRFNACVTFWELPKLPLAWIPRWRPWI